MHFQQVLVRECTDISYVAGEGVQVTVHKESVVVEEIKEVELTRSRRAQFIYERNYNRFGSQARGHAPSRLASGEKVLKTSVTQKEESKDICIEGYPEKYHLLLFLHIHNQCTTTTPKFTLHSVLFCLI